MEYPIWYQAKEVGYASVTRQGMFAVIRCRCTAAESLKNSIFLGNIPLGKCVPEGKLYTLTRRISAGKMPMDLAFTIKEDEVPCCVLREDAPVDYLDKLSIARLAWRGGNAVLLFEDQMSNSKYTGQ